MKILLIVLLLVTATCSKRKYQPRCALPGMSKQDVIARCGEPDDYEFTYGFEVFKYDARGLMTVGYNKIYFEQGAVAKIESSIY